MITNIKTIGERLRKAYKLQLSKKNEKFFNLKKAYAFYLPQQLIHKNEQYVDQLQDTLLKNMTSIQQHKIHKLSSLRTQLTMYHPQKNIDIAKDKINDLKQNYMKNLNYMLHMKQTKLLNVLDKLTLLNPLEIIKRGYALPYKDRILIKTIEQVNVSDNISIKISDGNIDCKVKNIRRNDNNERKQ